MIEKVTPLAIGKFPKPRWFEKLQIAVSKTLYYCNWSKEEISGICARWYVPHT